MASYIPPSAPPIAAQNQQQQQQSAMASEQTALAQYPPAAAAAAAAIASPSDAELSTANFNAQQQQMAMMMQMQQQWAAGGYAAPYMMPYQSGPMMMMPPQAGMDRPASRQSSRPPSRQSVAAAPVSSSRSMVNGQAGGQTPAPGQAMLPNQGYPGFISPGMYNPWFDPYWQSMYAGYQHPYNYGYNDEMMKYWKQVGQQEDDRYSHNSAAYSQSKRSEHSSSMYTWGSIDSLNDPY